MNFDENKKVAHRGGRVAGIAWQSLAAEMGKSVITSKNAVDFARLMDKAMKGVEQSKENNKGMEKYNRKGVI